VAKPFRIRDPVHNFVTLTDEEVGIIGTRIFQRLRGIRQLALANLVYPGALHTRFDHCIGVCHVAGMIAKHLRLTSDEERIVRLAALLHDLGHGPFSHVSEDALERYANRSRLGTEQRKEKIHELITADLIRRDKELQKTPGGGACETVVKLLSLGHGESVLRNIVSGPLDADKQDYLLRDSRFCGVPYGLFDIHQLHSSFVLGGPQHDRGLWVNRDGVHAVEQYVLAKYYLTTMVYRHQVRLITDQMITRAIVLGIEDDNLEELRSLYSYDGTDQFLDTYVKWDDARFFFCFGDEVSRGKKSWEMLDRLRSRRLLKQVFSERVAEFVESDVRDRLPKLSTLECDALRSELETDVANLLERELKVDVDPRMVVVFAFDIRSVRTTSRDDESGIMVQTPQSPRPFEEESTLFASINERYSEGYVEVYAPVTWESATEKERIRLKLRDSIRQMIVDKCRANPNAGEAL
jgi:HD superfamily phosphohydrolase